MRLLGRRGKLVLTEEPAQLVPLTMRMIDSILRKKQGIPWHVWSTALICARFVEDGHTASMYSGPSYGVHPEAVIDGEVAIRIRRARVKMNILATTLGWALLYTSMYKWSIVYTDVEVDEKVTRELARKGIEVRRIDW